MTDTSADGAQILEALSRNLAVQTVSNAITLQCMDKDADPDLQAAVNEAPGLIRMAGHDMDTLFPVAERPVAVIPDYRSDTPTPFTPVIALQPTTLITTVNDEQVAAIFWFLDEDNAAADMRMVAAAFGYSAHAALMSEIGPEDLVEDDLNGLDVLRRWNPNPPSPDHKLAAKFQSEDGPIAWFITPLTSTERDAIRKGFAQALKAEG